MLPCRCLRLEEFAPNTAPLYDQTAKYYFFAGQHSSAATTPPAASMLSPTKVAGLSAYIPHRVRRKWRATKSRIHSRQSVTSSIASLETSWSPSDTIKALRTHPWSIYDAQYLFLAIVAIFSLSVSEAPGPFAKTFAATALLCGVLIPATRQFLLPLLPTLTWLFLFNSCKYVISLLALHLILVLLGKSEVGSGGNIRLRNHGC